MKVAKLEGALLDYWVARTVFTWAHELFPTRTLDPTFKGAELFTFDSGYVVCRLVPSNPFRQEYRIFKPSTSWKHGGPIIEREFIELTTTNRSNEELWEGVFPGRGEDAPVGYGPKPLIAAMRAFVASKFGEDVPDDVPE